MAYKTVGEIPGYKGNDSCAINKFKQYAALMHWIWRSAYVSMGCDKYIPTTKDHPGAVRQAMNKYLNCKKLEPKCCSGGFSLW